MSMPTSASSRCSRLDGLKRFFARLFGKAEPPRPPTGADRGRDIGEPENGRPITTQEAVDVASEDSFPASDPPSFTGGIT